MGEARQVAVRPRLVSEAVQARRIQRYLALVRHSAEPSVRALRPDSLVDHVSRTT